MSHNWNITPEKIFSASPVIPVIVIKELQQAIPLALALFEGGIQILEITLRTPSALDVIQLLTREFPEALIGAGTVRNPEQLSRVQDVGAQFAMSPGLTAPLLRAGMQASIPLIPGISTPSELMEGMDAGYTHFKLFPALISGGLELLKALSSPFPEARFCPTGGINENNYVDFLALSNVPCIGGSWIVPDKALHQNQWSLITQLCQSLIKKRS